MPAFATACTCLSASLQLLYPNDIINNLHQSHAAPHTQMGMSTHMHVLFACTHDLANARTCSTHSTLFPLLTVPA